MKNEAKTIEVVGTKLKIKIEAIESKFHKLGDWKLFFTDCKSGVEFHTATMCGISFNEVRVVEYATKAAN